eukprot:385656-Pyramimonas_sp.AAC.1
MLCTRFRDCAIISIQEAHGNADQLQVLLAGTPSHYKIFHSATDRPGAGGVAILLPWVSKAFERGLPPSAERPLLTNEVIVPGRVPLFQ